jgi:hypothetical protein
MYFVSISLISFRPSVASAPTKQALRAQTSLLQHFLLQILKMHSAENFSYSIKDCAILKKSRRQAKTVKSIYVKRGYWIMTSLTMAS